MVTMENQSFLPLVQFLIVFLYLKKNIFLLLYFLFLLWSPCFGFCWIKME